MGVFKRSIPWRKKPSISQKLDYSNPIIKKIGRGEVWAPFSGNHLTGLHKNIKLDYRASSGTTVVASKEGLGLKGTLNTNDGVSTASTNFTTHGWNSLSLFAVVYFDTATSLSGGADGCMCRETTATGAGVSLTFMNQSSVDEIRAILYTTGSPVWVSTQDVDISDWSTGWYVVGMVYDGAKRHIYTAPLGQPATLERSDTCTGSILIQSGSSEFVLQGGLHTDTYGHDKPQVLTICLEEALTQQEVNAFCQNPWQIFAPQTKLYTYGAAATTSGVFKRSIPWTKRPQSPSQTKLGSYLPKPDFYSFWFNEGSGKNLLDAYTQSYFTPNIIASGDSWEVDSLGKNFRTSGSASAGFDLGTDNLPTKYQVTIQTTVKFNSNTVDHAIFDFGNNATPQQLLLWADTISSQLSLNATAGTTSAGTSGELVAGKVHNIVAKAYSSGGNVYISTWIDGKITKNNVNIGPQNWKVAGYKMFIGTNANYINKISNANWYSYQIWDGLLTDAQCQYLSKGNNYLKLLQPQTKLYTYGAAAAPAGLGIPIAMYYYLNNCGSRL